MGSSNCFIVFAVLITRPCLAKTLIKAHQLDSSVNLVNATVKILTSCNRNPGHAVGLAGNVPGVLLRELWAQKSLPITLIDDTLVGDGPVSVKFRHKLESFVLIASSSSDLQEILAKVKVSVWWNHLASFLILDWKSLFVGNGCSNALQLLWTAWEMDVLNAKVVCLHPFDGPLIYTFNPYTNQAPDDWEIRGTYRGKNNVPWTLFRRKYGNGREVCLGLDFDKTRDLGGHVIRTSVTEMPHCKNGKLGLTAFQAVMVQLLYPALNAAYKPIMCKTFEANESDDVKGSFSGLIADVANGISDISLLSRYPMTMVNLTTLYPHHESGLYAITNYNGYLSQLDKFSSIIDIHVRIGLHIVALSSIIFWKCFHRHDLMSAILNLLRAIKNEAFMKLPKDMPSRMYLACLLLLWVVMSGLYQGRLATVFTKQTDRPNVNTIHDLTNPAYKIYGNVEFERFFADSVFNGRFFGSMDQVCTRHVLEKKMAVCVHEKFLLVHEAITYSLHLSRKPIVKLYWVFQIRENWPIEQRVNIVIQRLIEADLIRLLHERKTQKISRLLKISENRGRDSTFKQLSLTDLDFPFRIVMMGHMCAAACFVIEVGIGRSRLRNLNVWKLVRDQLGLLLHNNKWKKWIKEKVWSRT